MKIVFSPVGQQDYLFWKQQDADVFDRINKLIDAVQNDPFKGIGKPEPLRVNLTGWWSRRITQEHRLVYRVSGKGKDQVLEIASCRFHYGRQG